MSIKREEVMSGKIDFSDIAAGTRLPRVHPGEILRIDFLEPMKITVYSLAQAIKVPRSRVNDIVLGRRGITTDTALRLARYFGTTPEFWINLQTRHDLELANGDCANALSGRYRPVLPDGSRRLVWYTARSIPCQESTAGSR